ncbi:hypothetical protein C5167_023082 [Papaver somniferum]|uniref:Uncharacterized protein n=1 Tax=Papaver somniferum TaxID=3469 RepID=A0A4Y7JJP3_PAPSO|nr:uncharacterized protein At1g66480-like [Papaver somniferum]RZC61334.1 hypothetical protein C5167_023082 [Papaver somniferum]
MGNTIGGGRKIAKVMKVNGETLKVHTPVMVRDVVKDYPGHVLIESGAVKHYGLRAKPLEEYQQLKPKKIYFLLEMPKIKEEDKLPRRVRSGLQMTAKDRLESLKLSKRSVSDLSSILNSKASVIDHDVDDTSSEVGGSSGPMRIRVRLPRSQVEKLVRESKDGLEAAEKIMGLCIADNVNKNAADAYYNGNSNYEERNDSQLYGRSGELRYDGRPISKSGELTYSSQLYSNSGELRYDGQPISKSGELFSHQQPWKPCLRGIEEKTKSRRKVGFLTTTKVEEYVQ